MQMCIYGEKNPCTHTECQQRTFQYLPLPHTSNSGMIHQLCQLMSTQNQQLLKISENNKILTESIALLEAKAKKILHYDESEFDADPKKINCESLSDIFLDEGYQYSIILLEEPPRVILKEKGFQITIGIIDSNLKRLQIPLHFKFQIGIYSMENPPKPLEVNIHGKKILRGTLQAYTVDNWEVVFNNVVINEVSSHYPNDSLRIVVQHLGSHLIKPLVINNALVRARKNNNK